ncbi:hypothetical protein B0H13DRAFT_2565709 [Mycena leptocephala]|nr:hypothetical protein B0H13DRAFT_2565709 [Mycena leptocephala]
MCERRRRQTGCGPECAGCVSDGPEYANNHSRCAIFQMKSGSGALTPLERMNRCRSVVTHEAIFQKRLLVKITQRLRIKFACGPHSGWMTPTQARSALPECRVPGPTSAQAPPTTADNGTCGLVTYSVVRVGSETAQAWPQAQAWGNSFFHWHTVAENSEPDLGPYWVGLGLEPRPGTTLVT